MVQPIILAAGKGTRMRSELPKAIFPLLGKPMVHWVIDACETIPDARTPIVVVGHKGEQVRASVGDDVVFVEQQKLLGSAEAVRSCIPFLHKGDSVIILYADQPLVNPIFLKNMAMAIKENPDALVIGTTNVPQFDDWYAPFMFSGRIVRNANGEIVKNVEYKNTSEKEREIKELNAGQYGMNVAWLEKALEKIELNPVGSEYYLTDIIEIAAKEGKRIIATASLPVEAIGINSPEDAAHAERVLERTRA